MPEVQIESHKTDLICVSPEGTAVSMSEKTYHKFRQLLYLRNTANDSINLLMKELREGKIT